MKARTRNWEPEKKKENEETVGDGESRKIG